MVFNKLEYNQKYRLKQRGERNNKIISLKNRKIDHYKYGFICKKCKLIFGSDNLWIITCPICDKRKYKYIYPKVEMSIGVSYETLIYLKKIKGDSIMKKGISYEDILRRKLKLNKRKKKLKWKIT